MAASASYCRHSYHTLAREGQFRNPSIKGSDIPILNEFVAPHIESFNALFDDSGLPQGDGDGRGLLSLAIEDIGKRVVFDGKGQVGTSSGQGGWGNKLTGALPFHCLHLRAYTHTILQFGSSRYLLDVLWCPRKTGKQ